MEIILSSQEIKNSKENINQSYKEKKTCVLFEKSHPIKTKKIYPAEEKSPTYISASTTIPFSDSMHYSEPVIEYTLKVSEEDLLPPKKKQ